MTPQRDAQEALVALRACADALALTGALEGGPESDLSLRAGLLGATAGAEMGAFVAAIALSPASEGLGLAEELAEVVHRVAAAREQAQRSCEHTTGYVAACADLLGLLSRIAVVDENTGG